MSDLEEEISVQSMLRSNSEVIFYPIFTIEVRRTGGRRNAD